MITRNNVTTDQIQALEHEASLAGDEAMASTCRLAIYGATTEICDAALDEVVDALQAARLPGH